jgi:thiamine phosphate synthase YjbQ (UPF0047 family)
VLLFKNSSCNLKEKPGRLKKTKIKPKAKKMILQRGSTQNMLVLLSHPNPLTGHSAAWGDDNGISHIRAMRIGPGITLSVSAKRIVLGTWQQIVVIDHDNGSGTRRIFVQVMGE